MIPSTNRDMQRTVFVESLHANLRKQAEKDLADHEKFIVLAHSYREDGLEESECVELLMIDGLSRDAAESLASMTVSEEEVGVDLPQYSFQFEDSFGRIWSSYDVGKIIQAASDDEAWVKADEFMIDSEMEIQKVISVSRIG